MSTMSQCRQTGSHNEPGWRLSNITTRALPLPALTDSVCAETGEEFQRSGGDEKVHTLKKWTHTGKSVCMLSWMRARAQV